MHEGDQRSHQDAQIVGQVLSHLGWIPKVGALPEVPNPRAASQELALDWQRIGALAQLAEIHGAINGVDEGRMSELLGRVASAGEQVGLAWTLDQELQRWYLAGDEQQGLSMATRALSEMCGYYLLSAAHGLANITLRTLALNETSAAELARRWPRSQGFAPFLQIKEAWPPFTATLAKHAVEAGTTTGEDVVIDLCRVLLHLAEDPRWLSMDARRHDDYHRWRPQGLPAGSVPRRSLWERSSPGTRSLSGGSEFYDVVDHRELTETSSLGLDALTEAMMTWDSLWPHALRSLGVPVFKTE